MVRRPLITVWSPDPSVMRETALASSQSLFHKSLALYALQLTPPGFLVWRFHAEPQIVCLTGASGGLLQWSGPLTPRRSLIPRASFRDPLQGRSFPFDCCGRLGADVVNHPVDARHGVADPGRDPGQEVVGELRPVGGHEILTLHRPNRNHVFIGSAVPHHADRLHRQQYG